MQALIPPELRLNFIPPSHDEPGRDVRSIPHDCGLLDDKDLKITGVKTIGELLEKVAAAEWTSEEVARAFIRRAIIAQQVVRPVLSPGSRHTQWVATGQRSLGRKRIDGRFC